MLGVLQAVPSTATAPVLVLVGVMMMGESKHINWGMMTTAVPAFLTIVMQPFTFSISHGIYAGESPRQHPSPPPSKRMSSLCHKRCTHASNDIAIVCYCH
jgi:hypothetical protein